VKQLFLLWVAIIYTPVNITLALVMRELRHIISYAQYSCSEARDAQLFYIEILVRKTSTFHDTTS